MPRGRLQIKCISPANATDLTYEITHEGKHGREFFISVEGEHLKDFLREKLRLSEESVQILLKQLYDSGHVLVDDVELSESDMASAGMQYI
jgi:hypothetical protein